MGLGDLAFGLVIIALGAVSVRFPEQIHRIAPYGHGGSAQGVRIVGWLIIGFGVLFAGLSALGMVLGK